MQELAKLAKARQAVIQTSSVERGFVLWKADGNGQPFTTNWSKYASLECRVMATEDVRVPAWERPDCPNSRPSTRDQ